MSPYLLPHHTNSMRVDRSLSLPQCSISVLDKWKQKKRMNNGPHGKELNVLWLSQILYRDCERRGWVNTNDRSNNAVLEQFLEHIEGLEHRLGSLWCLTEQSLVVSPRSKLIIMKLSSFSCVWTVSWSIFYWCEGTPWAWQLLRRQIFSWDWLTFQRLVHYHDFGNHGIVQADSTAEELRVLHPDQQTTGRE